MEKDYCQKCGECCRLIKVDFGKKVLYRDGVQNLSDEFSSMLEPIDTKGDITNCYCKFIKGNLCTNPKKPQECIDYPSSAFAILPENCGYRGVIFLKLENIKRQVRKLKEEIIHYEALISSTNNKFEQNQLIKIIKSHNDKINKYSIYGSKDW